MLQYNFVYVINRVGYEYNDEAYYRPECGGGSNIVSFTTRDKADATALELTASYLQENEKYPLQYADEPEFATIQILNERLQPVLGDSFEQISEDDFYEWAMPEETTIEQCEQIAKILDEVLQVRFYEVEEVPLRD